MNAALPATSTTMIGTLKQRLPTSLAAATTVSRTYVATGDSQRRKQQHCGSSKLVPADYWQQTFDRQIIGKVLRWFSPVANKQTYKMKLTQKAKVRVVVGLAIVFALRLFNRVHRTPSLKLATFVRVDRGKISSLPEHTGSLTMMIALALPSVS
jgi:hypothetical protein